MILSFDNHQTSSLNRSIWYSFLCIYSELIELQKQRSKMFKEIEDK